MQNDKHTGRKVDVLIPVYRPDERLDKIIERLGKQSCPVNRIRIINTEKKYFEERYPGDSFKVRFPEVELSHITAEEYDHGGTRRKLVEMSDAEYFVFMTDDALPVDKNLIENLLRPLLSGEAAVSYARQLPRKDLKAAEKYVRRFNYPKESAIKSREDIARLGIKAFFCPNVCAAYDRKVYDELGGFTKRTIFNEDMIFARSVLDSGHSIAYCADAEVVHSHNYTAIQQLKRNFDLGVSHAMYPEVFGDVSSEGEGVRMIRNTLSYLLRTERAAEAAELILVSGCKYLGYLLGKNYRKLPGSLVTSLSMNRGFWKTGIRSIEDQNKN